MYSSLSLSKVTVARAIGNSILGFKDFPNLVEAIEYINKTPAGQQWHVTFAMKTERQLPHDVGADNICNVDGPGYVGCFYD